MNFIEVLQVVVQIVVQIVVQFVELIKFSGEGAVDAGVTMSEMEFLDLASGDPISQDGSLRAFRYSQFSGCPSAPFNTAEPECLPSQFRLSASLTASPLLELEDHNCMLNDGPLGEPSSSLLCSSGKSDAFAEGVKCSSGCGEHLQSWESFSDSLGLSQFDAYPGSKKRECSPRRIYCDPRMLEEETQVSDVGISIPPQQASPVRSSIQDSPRRIYCYSRFLEEETQVSDLLSPMQHLQSAPQVFDSGDAISEVSVSLLRKEENKSILTTAAEAEKSLPSLAVKHAVEDFDDICQRWHSRRTSPATTAIPSSSAGIGLPSETKLDAIKPNILNALDSDHFQGQPTGVEPVKARPCAANRMTSAAVEDDDADIVPRFHIRRRITLAAITNLNSLANIRLPSEAKQEIIKPSISNALDTDHFRGQPTVLNPSPSTATNQEILAAVGDADDADIVQRWHNRKRIALSSITNLSSSSDSDPHKKLKQTPDKVVESRISNPGQLQSQLVKDPLLDNENWNVPRYGHDRLCKNTTISPRSGSETAEEDANGSDDTVDSCDSKLLRRKLSYSCATSIKNFLQPVTARKEPSISISSTEELGVTKAEHAEKRWTYPRKYRPGGRQRTMDAWIQSSRTV